MGGWTKTKLMLISTQVEVVMEVKVIVELGNILFYENKLKKKLFGKIVVLFFQSEYLASIVC